MLTINAITEQEAVQPPESLLSEQDDRVRERRCRGDASQDQYGCWAFFFRQVERRKCATIPEYCRTEHCIRHNFSY